MTTLKKGAYFRVTDRANRTSSTLGGRYPSKGNVNTTQLGIKPRAIVTVDSDGNKGRFQIAYDPLYSTEYGIYTKDWPISGQELKEYLVTLKKIIFNGGVLWTKPEDFALTDYLRAYPGNKKNSHETGTKSFFEVNLALTAEERMEKDMLTTKAKQLIYNAHEDDLLSYATALGLKTREEARLGGHPRAISEIKYELIRLAENDPEGFMNGWDNPATDRQIVLRKAADRNIIIVDQTRNSLFWREGGGVICTAPNGVDPIEFFADTALQNSNSESTYNVIKNRVDGTEMEVSAAQTEVEELEDNIVDQDLEDAMNLPPKTLIEFALAQKVIETVLPSKNPKARKQGYWFQGDRIQDVLGKAKLIKTVSMDPELKGKVAASIKIE
jgi:hypothetical protein